MSGPRTFVVTFVAAPASTAYAARGTLSSHCDLRAARCAQHGQFPQRRGSVISQERPPTNGPSSHAPIRKQADVLGADFHDHFGGRSEMTDAADAIPDVSSQHFVSGPRGEVDVKG